MGYEFDKKTMKLTETRPAIKSTTIWAASAGIVVGLVQIFPEIAQEVLPILSPQVAGIVTVIAGVIVVLRRKYAENPPIKGTVSDE